MLVDEALCNCQNACCTVSINLLNTFNSCGISPVLWYIYGAFCIMPSVFPFRLWRRLLSPNKGKTYSLPTNSNPALVSAPSVADLTIRFDEARFTECHISTVVETVALQWLVTAADELAPKVAKRTLGSWLFCKNYIWNVIVIFTCELTDFLICFQLLSSRGSWTIFHWKPSHKIFTYLTSHWIFSFVMSWDWEEYIFMPPDLMVIVVSHPWQLNGRFSQKEHLSNYASSVLSRGATFELNSAGFSFGLGSLTAK